METKSYTSIKQSNKLLSLGLNPSTADMMYPWHIADEEDTFEDGYLLDTPVIGKYGSRGTIPCWSLSALLKLMPDGYSLGNRAGKYYVCFTHIKQDHITTYDEPVDAVFEAVCWLVEQGRISVKKTEEREMN